MRVGAFEIEEFTSADGLAARFADLSGIPLIPTTEGWRPALSEVGAWFRGYERPHHLTAILPPNPTHATTFWTPLDDLNAVCPSDGTRSRGASLDDVVSTFGLDPRFLARPIFTLSAGERALVALAKCYAVLPSAECAVVCDPSTWLHAPRRPLLSKTLERFPEGRGAAHFLRLRGPTHRQVAEASGQQPQSWGTPDRPSWSLHLDNPVILYPPRRFPVESPELRLQYSPRSRLDLASPTLILGDNGVGKSSLAHLLAGVIVPESGSASVLVDSLECWPRLLMHDAAMQLFALTPTSHVEWAFRFSQARETSAKELFQSLQASIIRQLGSGSPLGSIGNAEHPTSLLQAKLMLVAERLVSSCRVLILDEPTWGLCDLLAFAFLRSVIDAAHARNVRVLVISHHDALPPEMFHSALSLAVHADSPTKKSISIRADKLT